MSKQEKAIRAWLHSGRESTVERVQRLSADAKRQWVAFLQARKEKK